MDFSFWSSGKNDQEQRDARVANEICSTFMLVAYLLHGGFECYLLPSG